MTQQPLSDQRVDPLARGVWGVVATPFTDAAEIDEASLVRLVQFYESIGAAGLTVLGVFGEAAALTASERMQVLDVVAQNSKLPIVAGVTSLATAPAIAEIENAQAAVGDRLRAVMVQANSGSAVAVIDHLARIHDATGAAVVLQDYPKSSGVTISTDNLIAVVEASPFLSAVKAEAPPTAAAIASITARVDVSVFGGLGGQGLLDELAAGSAGAMTGFSYPEALVSCVTAWLAGDAEAARAELVPYLPLINFEQQPGIALALRKELFHRRGLFATGTVRAPAATFPPELDAIAAEHLAQLDGEEVR